MYLMKHQLDRKYQMKIKNKKMNKIKEETRMIKKSITAVLLLLFLCFSFSSTSQAQIGTDNLFCPAVPNDTGWLEVQIPNPAQADFTAGLIGTVEGFAGSAVGGLDWMHNNDTFDPFFPNFNANPTPTTDSGSQLVTWWTQADSRNTSVQVTNSNVNDSINVHVRILDANCVEIRNFCDAYTPADTHVYDLGNLVSNAGAPIADENLQGKEGILVVTSVNGCPNPDEAIEHDYLTGQTVIVDSQDYMYGVNMYARQAFCDEAGEVNKILNGSFQTGDLTSWAIRQGSINVIAPPGPSTGVIDRTGISPNLAAPPATPPDPANDFMAYVVSSTAIDSGNYNGGTYIIPPAPPAPSLITFPPGLPPLNAGVNVAILESVEFEADASGTVSFDYSLLSPSPTPPATGCSYALAVLLINTTGIVNFIQDGICFSDQANLTVPSLNIPGQLSQLCQTLPVDATDYVLGPFSFLGHSPFNTDTSLFVPAAGDYAIQVVTAQQPFCITGGQEDAGGLVDNFRFIEPIQCFEGLTPLDGITSFLDIVDPTILAGQFNVQTGSAGGDVALISFIDDYGPPYRAVAAATDTAVGIWDDTEDFSSCGDVPVCFLRLGVDEAVVASQDFVVAPTLGPTLPPTTPPTLGPTPTPTNPPSGSGSGSCAIAASPVELGSGLANVLIPLVPVAFVFGVRRLRRKK